MATALLSGIGLSAAAGLNAYIPLLILALADLVTDGDQLSGPYEFLSSVPVILVLLLLLTIDIVADKIPRFARVNDLVQSAIRPGSGALAMMAATYDSDLNLVIALVVGLLVAGLIHAARTRIRVRVYRRVGPFMSPLVSFGYDALSAITAIVAVVLPIAVPVILVPYLALVALAYKPGTGKNGQAGTRAGATDLSRR